MMGSRHAAALLISASCCACGDGAIDLHDGGPYVPPEGLPDDPPEFTIFDFDGYAGPGWARLYWDATIDDGDILGPPPPPPIEEVKIWMSRTGPSEKFALLARGLASGEDSLLVPDLEDGAPYFFRLTAHDRGGGVAAASRPVWVVPGPRVPAEVSIVAPQHLPALDTLRHCRNLDWSPDGEWLAFIAADASGVTNVHLLDMAALSVSQLTRFATGKTGTPAWSPDQRRLAFTHDGVYRVWVCDVDDPVPAAATSGPVDFDPCWISSEEIVFCRGTFGPPNVPELALLRLSDASETPLTADHAIYKYQPAFSPVTGGLLYVGHFGEIGCSLYSFDLSTQRSERLTESEFWEDRAPVWSPDGNRVLFTSNRNGHFEIWELDRVSGALRQITRSPGRGFEDFDGALSPDGSKLAYFRTTAEETWLEIRGASGS